MVELKSNPVGIDEVIDRIQKKIHDPLNLKWGSLDVFGRVYKKLDEKGNISLERYVSDNEYKKVLFSEGNKIFFIQGNNPTINLGQATNDLWVVSVVKINSTSERDDEKYHIELVNELIKVLGLKSVSGIEYGMGNLKRVVLEPFEEGNFNFSDIHPYHVFMVKTNVNYQLTINEC